MISFVMGMKDAGGENETNMLRYRLPDEKDLLMVGFKAGRPPAIAENYQTAHGGAA